MQKAILHIDPWHLRMKITYTKELLAQMALFSRETGALLKDSFEIEDTLYFIIEPGDMGKAIGKQGRVVKELQFKLKKRIRLIEYNPDVVQFIANIIYPLKADISEKDGNIIIKSPDRAIKGQLIGRNAKNLNMLGDVAKRYFGIKEIFIE